MNILISQSTNFIIGIAIGLVLISVGLILLLKKKKTVKKPEMDPIYLNQLLAALGNADNITDAISEHQRLRIKVFNMKIVDADILKELDIPAFVKGKEITLLIKNHTKEVLSFINDKRKGDY